MGDLEEKRNRELVAKKQQEEDKRKALEEQKALELEVKRLKALEEQRLIEMEAEEKRLGEIKDADQRRQLEAAMIQKEFEEAERKRSLALKRLEEQRASDLREIESIEDSKRESEEKRKKEVFEATNVLTAFLDPSSVTGSQLQTPSYIWEAILELSSFLSSQDLQVEDSGLRSSMGDLVVKAQQ